ncbi:Glycosyl transferase family 2 [Desulfocicer vacuolatum DSM 3385]|uniref:Glycosyl transferase family 2 n=1 Tax=Desulfocicer vacuolatum DSM 3385 TaxID=1121400 RepID=A0A1W2CQM3_9BACT|nr:glycosyltransferase [Desulfocicer vacuolatum]SMC87501.1 Glycosyl transferase family 2 [Desulfocicer vacuolatum DSM 3385]
MKPIKKTPLVTAIIPTFNRGWCLAEAVTSVINQKYPAMEIIVVDDGSTDNTLKLLEPYMDSITLLHQENKGVSAARNLGIKHSTGDFLAFLDSDDLWTPDKTACQVDFFQHHSRAMICQTEEIWIRKGKRVNPKFKHKKPSGMIFEPSLKLCLVSPSAVMMRRDFFEIKGYFDETLPACEDYDLWLRTATDMPIYLVDQPCTIKHGGHGDQLSSSHSLDKYRIQSIEGLLKTHALTPSQQRAAVAVLRKKYLIYGQGCIKRGKLDEGQHCFERETALAKRYPH